MNKILAVSFAFLLASCSMMQQAVKPVEVKTIAERPPIYHPPLPYPMSLSDVDWEVLTPTTMQQYLDNLESGNAPRRAFYSLSSKEYENLSKVATLIFKDFSIFFPENVSILKVDIK